MAKIDNVDEYLGIDELTAIGFSAVENELEMPFKDDIDNDTNEFYELLNKKPKGGGDGD